VDQRVEVGAMMPLDGQKKPKRKGSVLYMSFMVIYIQSCDVDNVSARVVPS